MPLTVLEICNHVLQTCGKEPLTAIVASKERIGALLQNGAAYLRTLPLTWPKAAKTENMSGGTETFNLPNDFYRYIPNTAYITGNIRGVLWPTPDDLWNQVIAGNVTIVKELLVRQFADKITVLNGVSGETLKYEYWSSAMFTNNAGTVKKVRFTLDNDRFAFDDDLAILDLLWRYKQVIGAPDWQMAQAEAIAYQRAKIAAETGPSAITTGVAVPNVTEVGRPYTPLWV